MMRIGFLMFDDLEELDMVGPWEVFTMAAKIRPELGISCITIAPAGGTVRCAKGMKVVADHGFADAPAVDILVVPGGQGTRREVGNPVLLEWIAAVASAKAVVLAEAAPMPSVPLAP